MSFEDLLLDTVRQSPWPNENEKRKRVASGAEIISAQENMEKRKKTGQDKGRNKKSEN